MCAPVPVHNKLKYIGTTFKFLFTALAICVLFSFQAISRLLFFGISIFWVYSAMVVRYKTNTLTLRFKIVPNLDKQEFYYKIQQILSTKHGMFVDINENGLISVIYNGISYNIFLKEEGIFRMTWNYSSIAGVLGIIFFGFVSVRYSRYKKLLSSMGVIAYEIQDAYGIK